MVNAVEFTSGQEIPGDQLDDKWCADLRARLSKREDLGEFALFGEEKILVRVSQSMFCERTT